MSLLQTLQRTHLFLFLFLLNLYMATVDSMRQNITSLIDDLSPAFLDVNVNSDVDMTMLDTSGAGLTMPSFLTLLFGLAIYVALNVLLHRR